MPARRMRIELFDTEGNRYTIAFEGRITREKAVRLLDLVELLGGVSGGSDDSESVYPHRNNELSKYDKVRTLICRSFPIVWFTSREVHSAYEKEFREPISLSTIATYLSRLANKGILQKAGAMNSLKYKLTIRTSQVQLSQPTVK